MKNEIRNVVVTFALIIVVSLGTSQLYIQQEAEAAENEILLQQNEALAEVELQHIYEKRKESQLLAEFSVAQAKEAQMRLAEEQEKQQAFEEEARALANAKSASEAQAIKDAALAAAARVASAQKAAEAAAKQEAAILAAEKLAAEQQAAQVAAAEAAAKKSSRRSQAS